MHRTIIATSLEQSKTPIVIPPQSTASSVTADALLQRRRHRSKKLPLLIINYPSSQLIRLNLTIWLHTTQLYYYYLLLLMLTHLTVTLAQWVS